MKKSICNVTVILLLLFKCELTLVAVRAIRFIAQVLTGWDFNSMVLGISSNIIDFASSMNSKNLILRHAGKSFMYIMNSKGPKILP